MQVLCHKTAVPIIEAALQKMFVREYDRQLNLFTCQIVDGAAVSWL